MSPSPSRTWRSARLVVVAGAVALATAFGAPAYAAPGVDPVTVDRNANPGASFTIDKVVHIPEIPPKPDIILVVDTTGSMGPAIDNVRTNLHEVVTDIKAAQPDAQGAVVSYKDESDGPAALFDVRQNLTPSEPALQTAVDSLSASGGGDTPEGWLNALFQVSTGAVAFRSGSSRIVVLIGDASSHDPSNGHSLAQTNAALTAAGIKVVAVNVNSGGADGLDAAGQATSVVNATGGKLVGGTPDEVTAAILDGLTNLPVTVAPHAVCDAGVSVTFDKADQTVTSGADATFAETVTVAGDAPQGGTLHCTTTFTLNGNPAGDAFVQTITVHVNDVTPPVVTVNDQTVEATSPAGAVINYPATAVDNVDGPLTPTCVPPAGSTFPLGGTLVTCTATDAAGNTGTDTATMTVVDTTAPTVGCNLGPNPSGKIVPAAEAGFRTLTGVDIVDTSVSIYLKDNASSAVFGPFPAPVNIKLTQAPGVTPTIEPGQGAVQWQIKLKGDAIIEAVDDFGNKASATCLVPPPPK